MRTIATIALAASLYCTPVKADGFGRHVAVSAAATGATYLLMRQTGIENKFFLFMFSTIAVNMMGVIFEASTDPGQSSHKLAYDMSNNLLGSALFGVTIPIVGW